MARTPSGAAPKDKKKLLKPGLVTLAASLLWAAQHEPADFSLSSLAVWGLGALTIALMVRAVLALATPVFDLAGILFRQTVQALQDEEEG